jgi:hypothetical protein
MAGLLEGPSPKALRSAYSSKLVRRATLNFKNPTLFYSVSITVSTLFIFHVSLSEFGVVDFTDWSFLGTYIST